MDNRIDDADPNGGDKKDITDEVKATVNSLKDEVPREVQQRLKELGNFIRDQRNVVQLSLRRLSSLAGISNPYLSQIERGLRKPSAEILQGIAKGLRISSETLYVRAGILNPQEKKGVLDAIREDESLDDDQRDYLLEMFAKLKTGKATVEQLRKATDD